MTIDTIFFEGRKYIPYGRTYGRTITNYSVRLAAAALTRILRTAWTSLSYFSGAIARRNVLCKLAAMSLETPVLARPSISSSSIVVVS